MTNKEEKLKTLTRNEKDFNKKLSRLLKNVNFFDATLIVNGEEIGVHTYILAASCHYFDEKFTKMNAENKPMQLSYENIDTEAFRLVIQYFYEGTLNITIKNAKEMFQIANILSISDIRKKSIEILKRNVTIANCISIWKFAQIENLSDLDQETWKFINKECEKVSLTEDFLSLEITDLKKLLDSNVNGSETTIYNSIKNWCNYNPSRKHFFYILVDLVPLACLPNELLKYECNLMSDIDLRNKFLKAVEIRKHIGSKTRVREYSTLITVGSYRHTLQENKIIELFDIINHKWINTIEIDCNRIAYSTIFLDNNIFVIGGEKNSRKAINTVSSYNLKTGKMEILPSMKHPRSVLTAVVFNKHIFAIAGWTRASHNLSYVEKYDIESKTWTDAAPLLISRHGCTAKVFNNKIYVVGGHNQNTGFLRETEVYDPITNKWEMGAPMNEMRKAPGVAVVGNYLYAVSGNYNENYLTSAERYDGQINKWTLIESLKIGREYMGAANLMGKLIIAGGHSSDGKVEVYDEEDNEWATMGSLNSHLAYFDLIEIPWHLAENILTRINVK